MTGDEFFCVEVNIKNGPTLHYGTYDTMEAATDSFNKLASTIKLKEWCQGNFYLPMFYKFPVVALIRTSEVSSMFIVRRERRNGDASLGPATKLTEEDVKGLFE